MIGALVFAWFIVGGVVNINKYIRFRENLAAKYGGKPRELEPDVVLMCVTFWAAIWPLMLLISDDA